MKTTNSSRTAQQKNPWARLIRSAVIYINISLLIWAAVALFAPTHVAIITDTVYNTFAKVIKIIIAVTIGIGLLHVWVTPEHVSRVLGKESGWKGVVLASTIPLILGGSLFVILPLVKALREKGARLAACIAFISAWSGKAPLLPLEIEFLGLRFAVLRILLTIPFAVATGLMSELILERIFGEKVHSTHHAG
jgi:uncharacterized membrane protein YraQ (UPF0718 family)